MNPDVIKALAALLSAAPTGQILRIVEMVLELSLLVARDMPEDMRRENWAQINRDLKFWRDLFDKMTPNP